MGHRRFDRVCPTQRKTGPFLVLNRSGNRSAQVETFANAEFLLSSKNTILVLDDHAFFQVAISKFLEALGYRCICVGSPSEALKALDCPKNEIELVLCDYDLPEMDGFKFCQMARAKSTDVPFILMSGARIDQAGLPHPMEGVVAIVEKTNLTDQLQYLINDAISA